MKLGYVIVYTQDVPAALGFYELAFGLKRRFLHESNQYGELDTGATGSGAFGVGARGGVEVHYHLNPGAALVFGADLGYHRILAAIDDADVSRDVLTFGATMDIRL